MLRRPFQNLAHVAAFGVARANAIGPVGQLDVSGHAKVHNHFGVTDKTMDVSRLMILRVRNESSVSETKRRHMRQYNPSHLGYQATVSSSSAPQGDKNTGDEPRIF
jgi:hypothetical protein